MIIEQGKFYLQVKEGFVTDAVSYNPNIEGYNLFETPKLPDDILNQCYKIVNGQLVLDEAKHKIFLEKVEKAQLERQAKLNKTK